MHLTKAVADHSAFKLDHLALRKLVQSTSLVVPAPLELDHMQMFVQVTQVPALPMVAVQPFLRVPAILEAMLILLPVYLKVLLVVQFL